MTYKEIVKELSDIINQPHPDRDILKATLMSLWLEVHKKDRQYHSVLAITENSVLQSDSIDDEVIKIVKEGVGLLQRDYLEESDIELFRSSATDLVLLLL